MNHDQKSIGKAGLHPSLRLRQLFDPQGKEMLVAGCSLQLPVRSLQSFSMIGHGLEVHMQSVLSSSESCLYD